MRRLRSLLLIAAVALLGLAPAAGCKKSEGGNADLPPATGPGAPPLPELPTFAASGGEGATVGASESKTTGVLVAASQVVVGTRSSGVIVEIKFDEGDQVKKGDVLFRLDSRDAQLMRTSAANVLKSAKLQQTAAQREHDRAKLLFEQNALPRQQWDQVQTTLDASAIAVAQAQNALAMASKQIADATVRSPITGVVIKKAANVGEYAAMMPPTPVLVLQDQATLELRFRLPERALAVLGAKDLVEVTLPALGVTRKVAIQRSSTSVDPQTGTIEFIAVLDNADGALMPGLMAEVSLGAAPAPAAAPETAPAPAAPAPAPGSAAP